MSYMANLENPVLKNVQSNEIIEVVKSPFCIGRALECDYVIQNKIISRKHCTLKKTALGWSLTDLSTNGTLVNNQHVKAETIPLQHNDIVNMGLLYTFLTQSEPIIDGDNLNTTSSQCSFDENGVSDEFLSSLADNILKEVEKTDTVEENSQQAVNSCVDSDTSKKVNTKNDPSKVNLEFVNGNESNSYSPESTNKTGSLMNTIEFVVNKCSNEGQFPDIPMIKPSASVPHKHSSSSLALVSPKNNNKRVKVTVKTSNTPHRNVDRKAIEIKLPPEDAKGHLSNERNTVQDNLAPKKAVQVVKEKILEKTMPEFTTTTVTVTVNNSSSSNSTVVFQDLSESSVPAPINEVVVETTLPKNTLNEKTNSKANNKIHESQEPGPSNSASEEPGKISKNQNQFDDIEDEMMCSICANLFIKAVTLDCSHSFCEYCIEMWKKKKSECPICRKKIVLSIRTLVLDNFIEKFIESSSDEIKEQRKTALAERGKLEEQMAAFSKQNQNTRVRRSARNQNHGNQVTTNGQAARTVTPQVSTVITIPDSSSSSSSESDDSDDDDYDDLTILQYIVLSLSRDHDYEYNGRPGAYFGGYGRCFKCGDRGHWANGCPYS